MSSVNGVNGANRENQATITKLEIKRTQGITQALFDLVNQLKSEGKAAISDGKITASEWNNTIDKIIELQQAHIENGDKKIYTGGSDRKDYRGSFVVHPNQEIEFTAAEMSTLYEAMGVTIKSTAPKQTEQTEETQETQETQEIEQTEEKQTPVKPSVEQTDSTQKEQPQVIPPVQKADLAQVKETKNKSKAKASNRLSWGEIGKIAWKSAKNFVKGMFCDEEGNFSVGRTAATVGVVAGLALAAPAAAALGASAGVVAGIAAAGKIAGVALTATLACRGGKNVIQGTYNYYNSETKEDAVKSMEQAWDGGVEIASIPVIGGLMKLGSKLLRFVNGAKGKAPANNGAPENNATPAEPAKAEVKPTEAPAEPARAEVKPTEAPAEPARAEVKPTEAPAEPAPAEVKPTEAPAEPARAEVKPTEAPTEPAPAEVKPTGSKTEKPKAEEVKTESTIANTEFEAIKSDFIQKINNGDVVKPEGMDELVKSLVPHNYANDNTIIECMTRTKTHDYTAAYPKPSQKGIFTKDFRKIVREHGMNDSSRTYKGELPTGQKVVEVAVPTGRVDFAGRPIRAYIKTISPDGNYTQLQKDLLTLIDKQVIPPEGASTNTHILSVSMLESIGETYKDLNYSVDLEMLYSSIATALKQVL